MNPRQTAVLASIEQGATRSAACKSANVARRTFYNWLNDDPNFESRIKEAEAVAIETIEGVAYRCALKAESDPRYLRALFFFLHHRAGWGKPPRKVFPWTKDEGTYHEHVLAAATQLVNLAIEEDRLENTTPTGHPNPVGAQHAAPSPATPSYAAPSSATPPSDTEATHDENEPQEDEYLHESPPLLHLTSASLSGDGASTPAEPKARHTKNTDESVQSVPPPPADDPATDD